ncbi:hypothetical protein [Niabella drilacis]|uniref:Uncharacterized protein n=1 Tax=Niabella drilacis (strain DSM 25811 / CCM 8410 / CCUG 62505 / LMG 26954 / E90) TaxID=1285928 RepID=A0A1G6USI8_NIADE|nr:hypothetical protein [Niabella drilacis]SDD44263.1 hypothetical protein SAMN04487894_10976 [Niabella drilacis]
MIRTILYRKLPAGSLIATLVLSLVLFITCGMLLLSLYHFKYFSIKDQLDQRLADDLQSGMERVLATELSATTQGPDSALLFEDQTDSLYCRNELWGCFPVSGIKVTYKGRMKAAAFLYGAGQFRYGDASLYLADHDRPLSVTGDTYIEGRAYLPKSGIRSGFFQDKGFFRKNLVEGITDTSSKQLPPLAAIFRKQLRSLASRVGDTLRAGSADGADSLTQSFYDAARQIILPRNGQLKHRWLKGKLIVLSDSVIDVPSTAFLEDVILVAPFIHFAQGFKGAVQAIALDSITAENGCTFEYPTALAGIGRSNAIGNTGAAVTLHEGTVLHGMILALTENDRTNIRPVVKIKPGATVRGMVYNEGYTYLNGRIEGAVFTHFFFEQRGPMSMENILIDASITPSRWFQQAGYFSLFTGSSRQTILKWLR